MKKIFSGTVLLLTALSLQGKDKPAYENPPSFRSGRGQNFVFTRISFSSVSRRQTIRRESTSLFP